MGLDIGGGKKTWYWARAGDQGVGILVAVGWMFSQPRHLAPYTRLYAAIGCDSLVCHPHVLNMWFPSRAEALAVQILDELAKEVEDKPRPIVLATFSGGAKACLYKVLQILQGTEEASSPYAGKYNSVKACVQGQIHDSSPVDFVSSLGAHFASYSISQKLGRPVFGLPAITQAVAKILDALFLTEFEIQRADYWLTLKVSLKLWPALILCSTNDDTAPFAMINKFARTMRESGCQIDLVVWDTSDHVAHFRNFPKEYHDAVKSFLNQRLKAATMESENEKTLQTESCENGSATQRPLHSRTKQMSTQDTSVPIRNLLLNSKL